MATDSRLSVDIKTEKAITRGMYDTADWRMATAGALLEVRTGRPDGLTVSLSQDGIARQSSLLVSRSNTLPDVLVPSLVTEPSVGVQAESIARERALVQVAKISGDFISMSLSREGNPPLLAAELMRISRNSSAWLTLSPREGSLELAHKLVDSIRTHFPATLLDEHPGDIWDDVLLGIGRRRGDYSPGLHVSLERGLPPSTSYAKVLSHLSLQIEVSLPGLRNDYDDEYCHEIRVATRRMRTLLKFSTPVISDREATSLKALASEFASVCGRQRDLDVVRDRLYTSGNDYDSTAVSSDLLRRIETLRKDSRQATRRFLDSPSFSRFELRLRGLISMLEDAPSYSELPSISELAALHVEKQLTKVEKLAAHIDSKSTHDEVHNLRKRTKELRYLLEIFGSLAPERLIADLVGELKTFQQAVGKFQDTCVARDTVLGTTSLSEKDLEHLGLDQGQVAKQLSKTIKSVKSLKSGKFHSKIAKVVRAIKKG